MSSQGARLVRELWNANPDSVRDKAVSLISKILRNVLKNPTEPKFRKIKRTAIDKRLNGVRGALQILSFAGFQVSGEHYVLPETCELSNLVDVVEVFDKKAKDRAEAEAKLQEILAKNNKKAKAEMDKKEAHRKKVRGVCHSHMYLHMCIFTLFPDSFREGGVKYLKIANIFQSNNSCRFVRNSSKLKRRLRIR
mmetsp:Transcript_556/g.832  ORF Transcript_556/g.832 Transcript_556/m.832 type:complete len:194 (-) Transcript_556:553-1134(-)